MVYGKQRHRGQEAEFPRRREAGEIGEICNIVQYFAIENRKEVGAN